MLTVTKDKINKQTQSLNYILLKLAKLRKDYASLQAKYSFSTDTHFVLLKPASLFKKQKFTEAIGQIILAFYQHFPNEGIVLTEKGESEVFLKGESILKKDGFHLPVDLMAFVVEAQQPKIIEVIKEVPVEVVREIEVVKGIDFDLLQEMMKDVPNVTIKKQK